LSRLSRAAPIRKATADESKPTARTRIGNAGNRSKLVHFAFAAIAYLTGAALLATQVIAYDWKLDDAYITFAYARNWVEGHGIVFNIGKRVEGYTGFLWLVLSALGLWLGLPIEPWSTALGTVFGLATLWAAAGLAREFLPNQRRSLALVTAVLLAAWPPLAWWSASGMETMLFAFLVTATLWSYVRTQGETLSTAVLLALTAMTRPEGWLLAALLSLDALRLQDWRGVRPHLRRPVRPILLVAPVVLWLPVTQYLLRQSRFHRRPASPRNGVLTYFPARLGRGTLSRGSRLRGSIRLAA